MRLLVSVLVLLALPALVVAQEGSGQYSEWRVGASWVDMGDFGDGVGVGVDYILHFGDNGVIVSLEWADVQDTDGVTNRYGAGLGYIRTLSPRDGYQPFYGGSVVYTQLDDGDDDGCVGGRVFAGATLGSAQRWFLQFGFDFATELFAGANVNGPRLSLGLSF